MDHIDERMQHQKELAERRRIWEEQRKAEAERREREAKQDRLRDYLGRRAEEWADHTGSLPSDATISRWQEEYVNEAAAEQERDRAFRQALAEDIAGS